MESIHRTCEEYIQYKAHICSRKKFYVLGTTYFVEHYKLINDAKIACL